ncbi:MAG TPA: alpha/beta hydrolase [Anaerolineae bacterium]
MPYFNSNGHRLFYREQGSGPLLIILHGNTASSAHHSGELDYFGRYNYAVAPDFLGCGRSDRLTVWPDDWWEQAGRDAAALVTHLGSRRAIVMGTSGGAIAALWMAIQHPQLVQAVIADSCVERQDLVFTEQLIADRLRFTPDQVGFWQQGHGDDWEQVVRADTAMWRRWLEGGGNWFHGRLKEISCPVLFTNSLRDYIAPDVAAQVCAMALQITGSRIYFATEGGHPLMWSRATEFRNVADWFVQAIMAKSAQEDVVHH